LVHGNNRNFCVALVALDEESLRNWAKTEGLDKKSYLELTQDPKTRALIEPYIAALNKELANYESIRKFDILPSDMTLEAGDLTPSLKLKRKAVETKYKDRLDAFYKDTLANV
jgi:long-chain acyl-CoA synthetase